MNNNKLKNIILLYLLFVSIISFSQAIYAPLNNNTVNSAIYNYLEEKIYADSNSHPSIKPFFVTNKTSLPYVKKGLRHLSNDSNFFIGVSPVLTFLAGTSANGFNYNSSIGISLNSYYSDKLSFQINLSDNYAKFPNFIDTNINKNSIPHFGAYSVSDKKYNYGDFSGYISFSPDKYFNFQLGKYKNFFGDGYRSLLYSDNSASNWFLKGSVSVWHIKYVVVYNYFKDIDCLSDNFELNNKFNTSHYLSWNISKRININLFETVIWRGEDSTGYRGFDVNYLNPIIFFRPVEFSLGSPDNVIMGGGYKIRIGKNNHFYGQMILDEFKLDELKAGTGWWANKYGFQFGFKTYNLLNIKHLFFLTEYNRVRPFTYSHANSLENWGNYRQAMAHPLGSNFTEYLSIFRYSKGKHSISAKFVYSLHGNDYPNDTVNYGGNIYRSYNDNRIDYGNVQNQGYLNSLKQINLSYIYFIKPEWNLGFEIGVMYRSSTFLNDYYFHAGIKTYIFNTNVDF